MSECKISIVIAFIDSWDITSKTLQNLCKYTHQNAQLIMIDNGSDNDYEQQINNEISGSSLKLSYIKNKNNTGVLATFQQGLKYAESDIICYFHNDVLIHEDNWEQRVIDAFAEDINLGLAGIFGARGVHPNGGREGSMSQMLGKEWGKCECHAIAALHHGELMTDTHPSVVFDGVGLFFSREALSRLETETDTFADWRAPHHFYDRIFSLKVLSLGYHMITIGIKFDHYSGATANHNEKYYEAAKKWLLNNNYEINSIGIDSTIYDIAESQWTKEFSAKLPIYVDSNFNILKESKL